MRKFEAWDYDGGLTQMQCQHTNEVFHQLVCMNIDQTSEAAKRGQNAVDDLVGNLIGFAFRLAGHNEPAPVAENA